MMRYGLAAAVALAAATPLAPAARAEALQPVTAFDAIADEAARSVALFEEAGKVILHPRSLNCHPVGDSPLQGMDMRPHEPPVIRADTGMGAPGMMCTTCHGPANVAVVGQAADVRSIPGNEVWHLAPIEMGWVGQSLGQICAQVKDPARNGGKTMAEIVEHMAHDELVGWGWAPGDGREPVPGTQAEFGAIVAAWVDSGAHCPAE